MITILKFIPIQDGLYCLSCTDGVSPRHCHYVMKCSEGEVCITKSHLSKNGLVVFDTGCLSIEKCHSGQINVSDSHQLQQAVDQRTICFECCSSDLCNQKGCGQIGYPSPRGPVCFNCPQVSNPTLCDKIKVCDKSQECYIQKEEEFGDIIYSSGCIRKHSCRAHTDIFGKRNAEHCFQCCSSDLCNANCDAVPHLSTTPSTTVKTTTAAPLPRGCLGKEFLVLFMQNHESANESLLVDITTADTSYMHVTSSPKLNQTMKVIIDRNLLFTSYANFTFPFDMACHESVTEYKAVIIRTTELTGVTSFDSNDPFTNDGTLVIPTHKLSTEYLVSAIDGINVGPYHASQFAIGILHNNTQLSITFRIKDNKPITIDGVMFWSGGVYNKSFDELETFQVRHGSDLTGTYIKSNKPVAVFSGNECLDSSYSMCSHTVSQLPPIDQFDNEYIIPSFYNNSGTLIQVLSPFDSKVNITIGTNIISMLHLTEKEYKNIKVTTNEVTIVKSNRTVMVTGYAMGSSSNDPYMTVIPGVHQYLDYYKIVIPDKYRDNYLCVIIPTGSFNNLHINQTPVGQFGIVYQWSVISSGKSFDVRTILVKEGVYTLGTTDQVPFGLIVYGHRINDGYGFAGNFVSP
ncbi:IgGFc-binding protein-like [Crassostrea angulata]|uniref:IgGFc-binding protein-like n=1 Tax=Magallana angulata TaxID=2784310 RepID=UPI0022B19509|nr:IgGFc-binding protein-like [Crassostrea angulata]